MDTSDKSDSLEHQPTRRAAHRSRSARWGAIGLAVIATAGAAVWAGCGGDDDQDEEQAIEQPVQGGEQPTEEDQLDDDGNVGGGTGDGDDDGDDGDDD